MRGLFVSPLSLSLCFCLSFSPLWGLHSTADLSSGSDKDGHCSSLGSPVHHLSFLMHFLWILAESSWLFPVGSVWIRFPLWIQSLGCSTLVISGASLDLNHTDCELGRDGGPAWRPTPCFHKEYWAGKRKRWAIESPQSMAKRPVALSSIPPRLVWEAEWVYLEGWSENKRKPGGRGQATHVSSIGGRTSWTQSSGHWKGPWPREESLDSRGGVGGEQEMPHDLLKMS